jgi:hypothetical protein
MTISTNLRGQQHQEKNFLKVGSNLYIYCGK